MIDEIPKEDLDRETEDSDSPKKFEEKDLKKQGIEFEKQQEETRANLARSLVVFFGVTIVLIFVMIGYYQHLIIDLIKDSTNKELNFTSLEKSFELSKEIITIVWTSQAALLGSALGFYFGNRNN